MEVCRETGCRWEVFFQSSLQSDGAVEGNWLVPDPSHHAGRSAASGPSWRAEDRQEWENCFEVATHPLTVRGERTKRTNGRREKKTTLQLNEMVTDGNRSGVWIPHLVPSPLGLKTVILLFFFGEKGKKRWNEAEGGGEVKEERHRGELCRRTGPGQPSGVKERQNFDSLSSGEEK